jgi:four helix bundle protein
LTHHRPPFLDQHEIHPGDLTMNFRGYHGLTVWNRGVDLVELVYRLTEHLTGSAAPEVLTALRRAALAMPTHLAAGFQAPCTQQYLRHVHAAQLVLGEVETHLVILSRLEWAQANDMEELQSLLTHLDQLLSCLERYLSAQSSAAEP